MKPADNSAYYRGIALGSAFSVCNLLNVDAVNYENALQILDLQHKEIIKSSGVKDMNQFDNNKNVLKKMKEALKDCPTGKLLG